MKLETGRLVRGARLRDRVEAEARRMRAEEFDRLVARPLARALAFLWRLPTSIASRAWSPRTSPCD